MAAQAVHAARMSLLTVLQNPPPDILPSEIIAASIEDGHVDTLSVLQADISKIKRIQQALIALNIPCHLFMESGHAHNEILNGCDVVPTALGIGPYIRKPISKLTRHLRKM